MDMNNEIENDLKTLSTTMANPEEMTTFDFTDYIVFCMMLLASVFIGLYFACTGSKQKTKTEYLLGGKKMSAIPVGLSLVARDGAQTSKKSHRLLDDDTLLLSGPRIPEIFP